MGKPTKKRKQSEDDQVDDVMAWGKSKQNYYQQSQNEYSSASEEQQQAKQIYQNQLNELNKEDYYQLPDQDVHQSEEDDEDQGEISDQYICKEILWATQLAKMFEGIRDEKYQLRKKIYDSYLLILMALKQFKIPYVDQHPLISNLPTLKKALMHFETQLPSLYENKDEYLKGTEEDIESQNQNASGDQQIQQQFENSVEKEASPQDYQAAKTRKFDSKKNEGLEIYERIKQQKDQQRKLKKAENKKAREASRPKEAFRLVGQNEGRLANQKILKNKGLMKRRRRDDGNSRTKLRHKYEKALVRRKAKGPVGVKANPGRFYEGQEKVLYGKIASTKLK